MSQAPAQEQLTPEQQAILQRYQQLYTDYTQSIQELSEIEVQRKDLETVLNAVKSYEDDRKCYRMINNILTEMKAAEVVPQLEDELKEINEKYEGKKTVSQEKGDELNAFKLKHNIRVKGQDSVNKQEKNEQQGVL